MQAIHNLEISTVEICPTGTKIKGKQTSNVFSGEYHVGWSLAALSHEYGDIAP